WSKPAEPTGLWAAVFGWNLKQIMALGVMMTPALAVNGNVKVVGKVPSIAEIKTILQQAAA
ncbi:MAG TPA: thioredoxin family protein, partial [Candidatus Paceibacterota bacterium]|nr:thioredoxin family protein [Verrucomicrobiota bacterium]HRZ47164.1 thioredoxin family protein [Candidatus Paceibacterota bacterium]HRZ94574.1 thioredoxin family protein [Candidatus Paceibacterota bacterium]